MDSIKSYEWLPIEKELWAWCKEVNRILTSVPVEKRDNTRIEPFWDNVNNVARKPCKLCRRWHWTAHCNQIPKLLLWNASHESELHRPE